MSIVISWSVSSLVHPPDTCRCPAACVSASPNICSWNARVHTPGKKCELEARSFCLGASEAVPVSRPKKGDCRQCAAAPQWAAETKLLWGQRLKKNKFTYSFARRAIVDGGPPPLASGPGVFACKCLYLREGPSDSCPGVYLYERG